MARLSQVKEFNYIVRKHGLNEMYLMTVGDGSILDKERVKGWVVWESPKLGDPQDFAKWFPNKAEALEDWGSQC